MAWVAMVVSGLGGVSDRPRLNSVEYAIGLGKVRKVENGVRKDGSFTWCTYFPTITEEAFRRPLLDVIKKDQAWVELVGDAGVQPTADNTATTARVRQVLTDEMLTDVQDLPSGQQGYVVKVYARSQVGAKSGPYYTFSGEPIRKFIYRNPSGTTAGDRLDIYLWENVTGTAVERTNRWIYTASSNQWQMEEYSGDLAGSAAVLLRRTKLTRTNESGGYSQIREVAEAPSGGGSLVLVGKTYEKYLVLATGGEPLLLEETKNPDDATAQVRTTWTYYLDPNQGASFRQIKTLRRNDGYWENRTYTNSSASLLVTRTVFCWLNSPVDAEASARVVTEVRAGDSSVSSREERIAGVLVAREATQRQNAESGAIEIKTVSASPADLRTTTVYYGENDPNSAARGQVRSIVNPDGTVVVYTYAQDSSGNITTTESKGAGTVSAVTDGTRTVTKKSALGYLLEEVRTDIASGLEIYRKTADLSQADALGAPQKYVFFNNPDDYEVTRAGCCAVEYQRDRDGKVTTYTYDTLKRQTHAISRYSGQPEEDVATVYNGLTTTTTKAVGSQSVLVGSTTTNLGGEEVASSAPDADGDNQPEVTTSSYSNLGGGGRKTTVTHPDGSTEITETYADGQTSKAYGTAVPDTAYQYGTWSGGQFTKIIKLTSTGGTDEWSTTYTDLTSNTVREEKAPGGDAYSTISTYNHAGQLVKTVDPDGVTQLYAYNARGEQSRAVIDLNDNGQIDEAGPDRIVETLASVINDPALGVSKQRVTRVYAQNNATPTTVGTSLEAANGRGQKAISFGATTTSTQTLPIGGAWTVTTTRPDQTRQVEEYTNGRLWRTTLQNSGGQPVAQTVLLYHPLGTLASSADSRTGTTSYPEYYANGQLRKRVSSHNSDTTLYTRDALGRVIDTELPDQSHQNQSYTLAGQVEWTTGSQTYPTRMLYDEQGRVKELHTFKDGTNNAPQITTWNYDPVTGLLARKEYADTKGPSYTFTPGGRLLTRTWARKINGQSLVTTYGYNDAGDVGSIDYNDSTPDATLHYTRLGQPLQAANAAGTIDYGYDPATLRLSSETTTSGPLTRTLSRGYDSLGRAGGFTLLSGTAAEHQVTYGYDTAGRMERVTRGSGAGAKTFTYGYVLNSIGLIATVTGPVHTVTNTWEPNRDVLETKENKLNSNNTVISRFDYTVNAIGQRKDVTYSGTASGQSSFNLYSYDALGQVTSGQRYTGGTPQAPHNPVPDQQFGYDYDLIGNRKTSTDGTTTSTYTANPLNQYETVNSTSLTYDDDGNLLNDGLQSYEWDAENRLIKVTRGNLEVTSAYDAQSRRVRKTVRTNGSSTSDVAFLYDGWNVVAEYDLPVSGAPVLHAANAWGLDLSGSLQGAGGVGGLLERVATGGGGTAARYYSFTYDGNGNISELPDQTGSIAAHYQYGPFGEMMAPIVGPVALQNPWRWSTTYEDGEVELHYYGYRFYIAKYGTWLSRDPLEQPTAGVNPAFITSTSLLFSDFSEGSTVSSTPYTFANNDPVNTVDLLGLIIPGDPDPSAV